MCAGRKTVYCSHVRLTMRLVGLVFMQMGSNVANNSKDSGTHNLR